MIPLQEKAAQNRQYLGHIRYHQEIFSISRDGRYWKKLVRDTNNKYFIILSNQDWDTSICQVHGSKNIWYHFERKLGSYNILVRNVVHVCFILFLLLVPFSFLTKMRRHNLLGHFRGETELKVGVDRFNLKKSCEKKLTSKSCLWKGVNFFLHWLRTL